MENMFVLVCQVVLCGIFLYFGFLKLYLSKEEIMKRVAWGQDYSSGTLKFIGVLEFLGGIGILVPELTGILPILTPIAATGLALVMSGAVVVHLKRAEYNMIALNIFLIFVAAGVGFFRLLVMDF